VSSFQPDVNIAFPTNVASPSQLQDNDSDGAIETEEEYLDSTQLAELAQRFPTSASEAMAIEVILLFPLLPSTHLQLLSRDRCGMILPLVLNPP